MTSMLNSIDLGLRMRYDIENKNDKIFFDFAFSKNKTPIAVEDYGKLKLFYAKMLEKLENQLVLKKI